MIDKETLINTLKVCIIGEPNTGKSTLINHLLNKKISITSRKAQTTLKNNLGSLYHKNHQVIIYDTPGVFHKNYKLKRETFSQASNAIYSTDLVLLIISVKNKDYQCTKNIIDYIVFHKKNFIILLNKIDLISKDYLLKTIVDLSKVLNNRDIIPISALKKTGFKTLLNFLVENFSFTKDKKKNFFINYDDKQYITEIVREKILENIHDEIPYNLKLQVDELIKKDNKNIVINITIFLNKNSHRPIILGKNGKVIKKIGIAARQELQRLFKKKYHVYLFLKVVKSKKDLI